MDADNAFAPQPQEFATEPTLPLDESDATLAAEWAALRRDRQTRAAVLDCSKRGDYAGAIAHLDALLARPTERASDYNNRGLMHFKLGQPAQALADYDRAIALDPRLDSAYNNRANCQVALGNLAAALTDYQTALDFNPGNLRAWINQGITYRELGLYDLAIENFDFVLTFGNRLRARAYAERGRSYHLRGDWNLAIADYQRALSRLLQTRATRSQRQQVQAWLAELSAPLTA